MCDICGQVVQINRVGILPFAQIVNIFQYLMLKRQTFPESIFREEVIV